MFHMMVSNVRLEFFIIGHMELFVCNEKTITFTIDTPTTENIEPKVTIKPQSL